MIDSYFRAPYQRLLDPLAKKCTCAPNTVTTLALALGILTAPLLAYHYNWLALALLLLSGFCDTLDGSIARMRNRTSNLGSAYDIFSDRCVESALLLGLFLRNSEHGLVILLMTLSSLLCITSFLVVGIFSQNATNKSFHYSPGLIERGEAFCFFALIIIIPKATLFLGIVYATLVLLTGVRRMLAFRRMGTPKDS